MSVTNSNSLYGFNVTILISVFPAEKTPCLFHYLFLLIKLFLLLPFLLILGKKPQLKGVLVSHLLSYRYVCFFFSLALIYFISLCEKDHWLGPTLRLKYLTVFCDSHNGS